MNGVHKQVFTDCPQTLFMSKASELLMNTNKDSTMAEVRLIILDRIISDKMNQYTVIFDDM